jgi:hypothetical protein
MSSRIIKINRGDSCEFFVNIPDKADGSENYLTTNEVVYFALMYPHQRFEDAIIIKGYTHADQIDGPGKIKVKLSPNDTRGLTSGVYYYTAKLQRGGTLEVIDDFDDAEEVKTIIERTKFIIND